MPDGKDGEPAVSRADVYQFRNTFNLMQKVGMGEHNPFGFSCGSRSVDEGHRIVRIALFNFSFYISSIRISAAFKNRCVSMNLQLTGVSFGRVECGVNYNRFLESRHG